MIRAVAHNPATGKRTLILGLGRVNLERLQADQPIIVDLHNLDGEGSLLDITPIDEVVIVDASTPETLAKFMAAMGVR